MTKLYTTTGPRRYTPAWLWALLLTLALPFGRVMGQTVYSSQDFEAAWSASTIGTAPSGWSQAAFSQNFTANDRNWVAHTLGASALAGTTALGGFNFPTAFRTGGSGTQVAAINDYDWGSPSGARGRRLTSGAINLSASTSPVVRFWYYYKSNSYRQNLSVIASNDGGATWTIIGYSGADNAVPASVSLARWDQVNVTIPVAFRTITARFGLQATNTFGSADIYVDDFTVQEPVVATAINAATGGVWETAGTWTPSAIPSEDNDVTIPAGQTVTVSTTTILARCRNLIVNGTLSLPTSGALLVRGNVTVGGSGILNVGDPLSLTGSLYVGGNISVALGGNLAMSLNTTATTGATLAFIGENQTFQYPTSLANFARHNLGTLVGAHRGTLSAFGSADTLRAKAAINLISGAIDGTQIKAGTYGPTVNQNFVVNRITGSFSNGPIFYVPFAAASPNARLISNSYVSTIGTFWQSVPATTLIAGPEIRANTVTGSLLMSTFNNLQLNSSLTLGDGDLATTSALTLTRGIISIPTTSNFLRLLNDVGNPTPATPYTAAGPAAAAINHGSYVAGQVRIQFLGATTTRTAPLGFGTAFADLIGGPTANAQRTVSIVPGATPATVLTEVGVTPTGTPSGTGIAPVTGPVGVRSYNLTAVNLALPTTTTFTINGVNTASGNVINGGGGGDNITKAGTFIEGGYATTLTGTWRALDVGTGVVPAAGSAFSRSTPAISVTGALPIFLAFATDEPACAPPTITVSPLATSATLNFTNGQTPDSYNWKVVASGGLSTDAAILSGNTTNLATVSTSTATAGTAFPGNLLAASTSYTVYVQGVCSGTPGVYNATGVNFTTPCAIASLPVLQGFNTATLPTCWQDNTITGSLPAASFLTSGDPGATFSSGPVLPVEGARFLGWNTYNNSGASRRLVAPVTSTTGTPSVTVSFKWYQSTNGTAGSYLTEGVQVQYSTDGITYINVGSLIRRYGSVDQWTSQSVVLPVGAGNQSQIYVGFVISSNAGYNSFLDDAQIAATPTCFVPTGLSASPQFGNSATISYLAPVSGTAPADYQYVVSTTNTTPAGAGTSTGGALSFTATGLVAGSPTYIFVRSNCGAGDFSTWALLTYTYVPPLSFAVTKTQGSTYSTILPVASGSLAFPGWANAASTDDVTSSLLTLPFSFPYQGQAITQIAANTNGWLGLKTSASTLSSSSFTNQVTTTSINMLMPMWDDFVAGPTTTDVGNAVKNANIRYFVDPGNAFVIVEWGNMTRFVGSSGFGSFNWQVKLYATGQIEYLYGGLQPFDFSLAANLLLTYTMGMTGAAVAGPPTAGQVFVQNYANSTSFGHRGVTVVNRGTNKLQILPDSGDIYTFIPGVYSDPGFVATPPVPANNERATAQSLPSLGAPPTKVVKYTYTTRGATASAVSGGMLPSTPENGFADDDVWFKFRALSTAVDVNVAASGGMRTVIQVYDNSLNLVASTIARTAATRFGGIIKASYTAILNEQYFVRVFHYSGFPNATQSVGSGTVTAGSVTAVPLSNRGGGYAFGTGNGIDGPEVTITDPAGRGAYYNATVTAADSGLATVGTPTLTQDFTGSGYSASPGVYIAPPSWSINGTFAVYVNSTPTPPANDRTINATVINPVPSRCNNPLLNQTTFASRNTLTAPVGPSPGTITETDLQDVWYKFVATANGSHTITATPNSSMAIGLEVLLEPTTPLDSTTWTSVTLSNSTTQGQAVTIASTTLIPGRTYYVRAYDMSVNPTAVTSSFSICIFSTSCFPPSAVSAGGVSTTQTQVSWTAGSPAPASGYYYKVVASGGSYADAAVVANSTAAGVTSAVFGGLVTGTSYTVWVRSFCGGTDSSDWAAPATFTQTAPIGYNVATTIGTYAPLAGGVNVLASAFVDNAVSAAPISLGGSFSVGGQTFTTVNVSSNGFVWFGTGGVTPTGSSYVPISGNYGSAAIAPYGLDLKQSAATGAPAASLKYQTIGSEFIVEWANVSPQSSSLQLQSIQLRLNLSTNAAVFSYDSVAAGFPSQTAEVGVRGTGTAYPGQVFNRTFTPGGDWRTTFSGGSVSASIPVNSGSGCPADNLVLTYTPTTCLAYPVSQAIIAADITVSTAILKWSPAFGAAGYEIRYKRNILDRTFITAGTVAAGITQFTITGLLPTLGYVAEVRATCGGGQVTYWSAGQAFTTKTPLIDVAATAVSGNTPTCGLSGGTYNVLATNRASVAIAIGTTISASLTVGGNVYNGSFTTIASTAVNGPVTIPVTGINLATPGKYPISYTVTIAGDEFAANNTRTNLDSVNVAATVAGLGYASNFNGATNPGLYAAYSNVNALNNGVRIGRLINAGAGVATAPAINPIEGAGMLLYRGSLITGSSVAEVYLPCFTAALGQEVRFLATSDNGSPLATADGIDVAISTNGGPFVGQQIIGAGGPLARRYDATAGAFTWKRYAVPLPTTGTISIRLRFLASGQREQAIDNIYISTSGAQDASLVGYTSPLPPPACAGNNAPIRVQIKNTGTADIVDVPVRVIVTGPSGVTQYDDVANITVTPGNIGVWEVASINMLTPGNYAFAGSTLLVGDTNTSNDAFLYNITIDNTNLPPAATAAASPSGIILGQSTLLSATAPSGIAGGTFVTNSSLPAAIVDNGPATVLNIPVTGVPQQAAALQQVRFTLTHLFRGDINIWLTSPSGVRRDLILRRGGSGDNFQNMVLGTSGPSVSTIDLNTSSGVNFSTVYTPEQAFAGFTGSATGTWTFSVQDVDAGIAGSITAVSLVFETITINNVWSVTQPAGSANVAGFTYAGAAGGAGGTGTFTGLNPGSKVLGTAGTYNFAFTSTFQGGCGQTVSTPVTVTDGNVWTGAISNDWNLAGNWQFGLPAAGSIITIPGPIVAPVQPVIGATGTLSVSVSRLTLLNGAGITVNTGSNITISGDVIGSLGNITGPGVITLANAAPQNINGTVTLSNLTLNNTNATGLSFTSGSELRIAPGGTFTMAANSRLTVPATGKLVLQSSASGTARMAAVPNSATFTGNLTMERYIPSIGWHFIGSPVKTTTLAAWQQAWFARITPRNNANLFEYRENDTTSFRFNNVIIETNGWKVPTALTNVINPGSQPKGYRGYFNNTFLTVNGANFRTAGPPFIGTVLAAYTKSSNGYLGGGYNLLANPYPSELDWDAVKADVSNSGAGAGSNSGSARYIWDPAAGSYNTYVAGTTALPGTSRYISSSQAFFVLSAGAGSLSFREAHKSNANSNTFKRDGLDANTLFLELTNGINRDYAGVYFRPGASRGFDLNMDAIKMDGQYMNISSLPVSGLNLAINSMPELTGNDQIPLKVGVSSLGAYTLNIQGIATMDPALRVFVQDNFLGTLTEVTTTGTYPLTITADPVSTGAGRLVLVFQPASVTGAKVVFAAGLSVWPNPAQGEAKLNVGMTNVAEGKALLSLIDALGRTVLTNTLSVTAARTETTLDISALPAGVYTLRAATSGATMTKQVIIK